MPLSGDEHMPVAFTLGPWLVGMSLDLFIQGILTAQFSNYFSWYGNKDSLCMRIAVGVLALLTTLKSVQALWVNSSIVWIQEITYYSNIQGVLALPYTAWYVIGNILMVAVISFYVQCFFCYRLYALSKMWWITAPIMVLYVLGLTSAIVATYYIASLELSRLAHWVSVHYATAFVTDVLLSSSTAWFLLKNRNHVLPQTASLLNALVRLTFQTAALPAICAMINLIFVYVPSRDVVTVFIQALPKLYAISMMWTLNARRAIRVAFASAGSDSTEEPRNVERTRREEISLGNLNRHKPAIVSEHDMFVHPDSDTEVG
ncbi:hypothetical protein IW261DRAFT_1593960 [Armillaria novae-zelandiae]|uniref:DUF6534 domain-containing protein n=1 Tax=Armillaria novae-zelandiae TaxID=153914 RepID=A0AA39P786_9AGAR|nr:hypothetical protein IW261DRAFT_1593960 [Armillaria novae-zelandiae]